MKHWVLAVLLAAGVISLHGASVAADRAKAPSEASAKKALEMVNKGNKLDDQGEPAKAIKAYREAIKLDPGNFEAYFNLGLTSLKTGKNAEAEKALRSAAAIDAKDAETQKLIGVACIKQGKKGEAIEAWQTSLSLKPDQPDVKKFIEMNEEK